MVRAGKFSLSRSLLGTCSVPFGPIRSILNNHYVSYHRENILPIFFLNFFERSNLLGFPSIPPNKPFLKVCHLNKNRINLVLAYCESRKQSMPISFETNPNFSASMQNGSPPTIFLKTWALVLSLWRKRSICELSGFVIMFVEEQWARM